ncbi:hypothetical protein AAFF_G00176210 [Aldrovandia affinis]|uniref:Integrase catalytic domain-containing protein n=1 Tax=Aldrovandia affinis TaxID=143900 RepID=A0AAD7RLM0_9TELE|nr:hypothetical protein AAFF_G00176210 [Aldrovandia affinis]
MAADQQANPEVQAYRSAISGLKLADIKLDGAGASLLCDVSTGQLCPQPLTPWAKGITEACLLKVPERRFDHVNVDIVGPLPPSCGFTYLLTMVDRTTRWPEAVPLASTTTADVAWAFIDTWVSRFGTPSDLSSDRGSQFTSELWAEVARALGVRLHHTTAFHPQANKLCERFHRSMKVALRASLKDDSWTDRLPWVLLGLRTAPKEDLQSSSAELVFGQALRVPGDFIPEPMTPWVVSSQRPALLNKGNAFKLVPTSQHGLPQAWIPSDLSTAQYVFIRHNAHRSPLKPPYNGPFRVMETGDKTFIVDVGGKPERIRVDRLKPTHQALDQPVVPATAPRRGRPPSTRPTRAAQVPSPDVAPQTTVATLPRTRAGREIKAPVKLMLPVFVNSGGPV